MRKSSSKAAALCKKYREALQNGLVYVIDPSSGGTFEGVQSSIGYTILTAGQLTEMGKIVISGGGKSPAHRLAELQECLLCDWQDKPDILVVEDIGLIRNGAFATLNKPLLWSVGVVVASLSPKTALIEIRPQTWQRFRPAGYKKSDQNDAAVMAWTALQLAEGGADKVPNHWLDE